MFLIADIRHFRLVFRSAFFFRDYNQFWVVRKYKRDDNRISAGFSFDGIDQARIFIHDIADSTLKSVNLNKHLIPVFAPATKSIAFLLFQLNQHIHR